jgi:two-component system NtrC family sensor kinase
MNAGARILVVDDEEANVLLVQRVLEDAGYTAITTTTDSREVLDLYRRLTPDLILLDLMMPHLDGLAVLGQLQAEIPSNVYVPVLVLTADATLDAKRRALEAGARDFLTKPFEQFEVLLRIRNLLDMRFLYLALEQHNRSLEETVRQRTERLLQSEKVAAMGSLLAGVAHELNNPLTVLNTHAQILLETADASMSSRATKIQAAADRCVRIVRNFLALARHHNPERSPASLAQIVQEALELLAYEMRTDGVAVEVDVARDIPPLWADPHQLHQVLVNLMTNAHYAMRHHADPRRLRLTGRYDAGARRVRLEIADTGPGMSPDVQAKIFDAFFTTKPVGEGTGLGLSLCRGIVEDHGGTITVDSAIGRGTVFVIELPVVERPAAPVTPAAVAPTQRAQQSRILVVDDEDAVSEVVAEALGQDGHQVDIAANGAEALASLSRTAYDLIVSDTKMPVLDGEALYAEVVKRFPRLGRRTIFLTGDVLSREKRKFLEETGRPFLTKPFDLDDLRQMVARVLLS